ncbi:hypothetical protein [Pseudobutyrivibrio xylanivorans]|nr:hypothetical protein [Pseudobutyrivibrio xylanivorans]
MKTWNTPVVEEINFTATQYGGPQDNDFDNQWYNTETGKWEGTFKS